MLVVYITTRSYDYSINCHLAHSPQSDSLVQLDCQHILEWKLFEVQIFSRHCDHRIFPLMFTFRGACDGEKVKWAFSSL